MAAATFILVRRFYGAMTMIGMTPSLPLWIVAAVCLFTAYMIKKRRAEGKVGLDRSQLNPMMVANFLLLGKAGAWAGALSAGVFSGLLVYIAPRLEVLAAAQGDLPGTVSGVLGGLALAVAGIVLERACEVSPPTEGQGVG